MENHCTLLLLFAVAWAAAIATSNASCANLQLPREFAVPAQYGARFHQAAMTKRSIFYPYQNLDLVVAPNRMGKAPRTLRYCWEYVGDATSKRHRQWIREALNETWNRLKVVRFQDAGFCDSYPSARFKTVPGIIRVALLEQACGYSWYDPQRKTILLRVGFTSHCFSICTAKTESKKACIKNIAVHEFGHSLGLMHEHFRFDTPIMFNDNPCTKDPKDVAAKAWYQQGHHLQPIGSWDDESVMNLCGPGFFNFTNYRPLSLGDRSAILSLYGQAAYFNSSCNSRNSKKDPFAPACQSAVQKFCEHALDGSQEGVIGVLRNVTTNGLNITCFKPDFIQRREQKRESVALNGFVRPVSEPQVDANTICRKTLDPEMDKIRRFVGFSIDIGEDQPVIVCKESLLHAELNGNDLLELSRKLSDFECHDQLNLKFTVNGHYPLSCTALVDNYCEIHKHGAAGIILAFDPKTKMMEISCFQPVLKTELFSYLD